MFVYASESVNFGRQMAEKTFCCTNEGLAASQAFLEGFCDLPKPAIVMDEIASNIVRCSGANEFAVRLDWVPEGLQMVFSDGGVAFDPVKDSAEPDLTASADERGIGGLGIFMVKKMTKSICYERRDGKNVLTLVM